MTCREGFTLPVDLLEQGCWQGLDILTDLIQVILNKAMLAERQQHINADPYQQAIALPPD